jgi:hypothetical protein
MPQAHNEKRASVPPLQIILRITTLDPLDQSSQTVTQGFAAHGFHKAVAVRGMFTMTRKRSIRELVNFKVP